MALGPPVATKPSGFAVGFCGDQRPSCHVFHTSRQAMIKTYNIVAADNLVLMNQTISDHSTGNVSTYPYGITRNRLPWWRHQEEIVSALLAFCDGNSPVNFLLKGQRRGALMFSLICAWTNAWVNNRNDRDLRHNRAHYDVTVMFEWEYTNVQVSIFLHLTISKFTIVLLAGIDFG